MSTWTIEKRKVPFDAFTESDDVRVIYEKGSGIVAVCGGKYAHTLNAAPKLLDALDKLLALYRKETNLHYGLDNPITKECREILVEARRV